MTADVFGDAVEVPAGGVDPLSPEHVVNLVTFLSSPAAAEVNGQVFIVYGPQVTLVAAPTAEHKFSAEGPRGTPPNSARRCRITLLDVIPSTIFRRAR